MILLNSKFSFGGRVEIAKVIDATDETKIRINGTEFFQRVNIKDKDLEGLSFEEVGKFGWQTTKPLSIGKYKVTYNQADYFMTYLDELDLFKTVVLR